MIRFFRLAALAVALLAGLRPGHAQTEPSAESDGQDPFTLHRVFLVPYDPLYYLSDADHDLIEQTKIDPQRMRRLFRDNIDYYIKNRIGTYHPCVSALNDADSIPSLNEALGMVYGTAGYRYEKPMPLPFKKERMDSVKNKKNPLLKDADDSRIAAQYLPHPEEDKYMNAVLADPAVLASLYETYDTDIFVFVNQFEIRTNYKSCLDIAKKVYKREILLHFSVFDKNGKQLAGACVTSSFPSDSNNAYDIIRNCFSELAGYVSMCTP